MIKYIYVPEEEDIDEFYEKAYDLGINQIIHGRSDIIDDYIDDYTRSCVVQIPEFRGLNMPIKNFKEGTEISIHFIDEWLNQNSYMEVNCIIYKVDIEKPWEKYIYTSFAMKYDFKYSFFEYVTIDEYGEYIIEIVAKYNDHEEILCKEELVIYKEYKEVYTKGNNDFKFEI